MVGALEQAKGRWGTAAALQGGHDPRFIAAHRAEIERRLVARGLTEGEAAEAFLVGLQRIMEEHGQH